MNGAAGPDGARSRDGAVWGCYLHGLFHNDRFRSAWLSKLAGRSISDFQISSSEQIQLSLDRLADTFETHVDFERLMEIVFESAHAKDTNYVG